MYGVTRERIREIESKTMEKLKDPAVSLLLRDFHFDGVDACINADTGSL